MKHKNYTEIEPYERRLNSFLKTGEIRIKSKLSQSNPAPDHDFLVRCSTPGHLMNELYNDNAYRVNITRHHYDQVAYRENREKKIHEDKIKEELQEQEKKRIEEENAKNRDSIVGGKWKGDKNLFISRNINFAVQKSKRDAKNQ